jgi:hypothetical protein
MTLLHELGHALGLKHSFAENAAGDPNSALPSDLDNRVNTVMSYTDFPQSRAATLTNNVPAYFDLEPSTYGAFDIAALQYLYGANTAGGDNGKTYAFSPNSPIFETAVGQNLTIDCSQLTLPCTINMTPGTASNLGITQKLPSQDIPLDVYNGENALTLAYSASVSDVLGGAGNDTIIDGPGDHSVDGGGGLNTFEVNFASNMLSLSLAAEGKIILTTPDSQDTLTNFSAIALQNETLSLAGNSSSGPATITLATKGSLYLAGAASNTADNVAFDGAGELILQSGSTPGATLENFTSGDSADFAAVAYSNGDVASFSAANGGGGSVIVRNLAGAVVANFDVSGASVATKYDLSSDGAGDLMIRPEAAAVGDFNDAHRSDILFRNATNGAYYVWEMNGVQTVLGASLSDQPNSNWTLAGVGEFGDGNSDLLWSYNNPGNAGDPLDGAVYLSIQNGAQATGATGSIVSPGRNWQVAGIGDFDGDGKDDILWRYEVAGNPSDPLNGHTYIDFMNGTTVRQDSGATSAQVPNPNWRIVMTGDFTGGSDADVLWQYDNLNNAADPLNGAVYEWEMNGRQVASQGLISQSPGSANWKVVGADDFGGQGDDDILFRYHNAANPTDPLNGVCYIDFMNGTTVAHGAPTQWQVGESWQVAGLGDYAGEGKTDILFQNAISGETYMWMMNGASVVSGAPTSEQAGPAWTVQRSATLT